MELNFLEVMCQDLTNSFSFIVFNAEISQVYWQTRNDSQDRAVQSHDSVFEALFHLPAPPFLCCFIIFTVICAPMDQCHTQHPDTLEFAGAHSRV